MTAGLMLEGMVAVLLVVTIGYCFILNRRLAALRHGQNQMHAIVLNLDKAAEKAKSSVELMRASSMSISDDLSQKLKAGRAIADELGMIVESGNSLADRLAGAVSTSRTAYQKPGALDALPRLDQGFRRQVERDGGTARAAGAITSELSNNTKAADNDLRVALRAMR